jgi:ethanolamine utilization protein EutQ
MSAKLIKGKSLTYMHRGGPPGNAGVARAISTDLSNTMGAGVAHFDDCSISWTVLYDEVIYVIDGVFRLVTNECVLEGEAGDIIWIPKGTELKYEGAEAHIFYAVYPGNWKAIQEADR